MKLTWVKFHLDFFDDPRVKVIETMPESNTMIAIWFKLVALVGGQNTGGRFVLRTGRKESEMPLNEEIIAGIASLMESSFADRRANLDRILNRDLLLIEDLGAERCTEYMLGHVYNVIDGRYRSGKPMVITTNIPLKDIYQPSASSPWQRIFDRITERCYPIEFTGASRRRSKAALMRRSMEERLGSRDKD